MSDDQAKNWSTFGKRTPSASGGLAVLGLALGLMSAALATPHLGGGSSADALPTHETPETSTPTRRALAGAVPETTTATAAAADMSLPGTLGGSGSVWRASVASAPVAADSAAMIDRLTGDLAGRYGGVAAFNLRRYTLPVYDVPADQPRVSIEFDDCQDKGYLPDGLMGPGGHFMDVPLPSYAMPSDGRDAALAVYSPDTDQLWELWRVKRMGDSWSACWGGRIDGVSTNDGLFPFPYGVSAAGVAITPGLVSVEDVTNGRIEHGLYLAIPNPADSDRIDGPATRSDGEDPHPDAIPLGSRLRLDPSLDIDSLGLHPIAAMVAEAAQQYGFIVSDSAGTVAVLGEDPRSFTLTGQSDPWVEHLAGAEPHEVFRDFPWGQLDVVYLAGEE